MNTIDLDLIPTTKSTFDAAKKSEHALHVAPNSVLVARGTNICFLYLHIEGKYYHGIVPFGKEAINMDAVKALEVSNVREFTRVTCNKLWSIAA